MSKSRLPHSNPAHALSLLKPAVSAAPTTLPNAQDGVLSTLILDNACPRVLREDAPDTAGDAGVTEGRGALALRSPPPPWSFGTWRVAPGHPRSLGSTVPCSRSSARPAALHWAASRPCNEAAPCVRPAIAAQSRCFNSDDKELARQLKALARSFLPSLAWSKQRICLAKEPETAFCARSW
jgi:hypothetical protein